NGDRATDKSVAVLIPGVNTPIEASSGRHHDRPAIRRDHRWRRRRRRLPGRVVSARQPRIKGGRCRESRYALDMAPRLVAFGEDVDRPWMRRQHAERRAGWPARASASTIKVIGTTAIHTRPATR